MVSLTASPSWAQESRVEIGASMANVVVGLEDEDVTVFGVPTVGFGLLSPGIYASVALGQYVAVEPQLGLLVVSGGGETNHAVNFVGQVDYFPRGQDRSSPYVFASAGVIDVSGQSETPKTVSGGVGYRFRLGDRLVFRVDGRFTHFTEDGGNAIAVGLNIGGLF
jgi:hypothetical protein